MHIVCTVYTEYINTYGILYKRSCSVYNDYIVCLYNMRMLLLWAWMWVRPNRSELSSLRGGGGSARSCCSRTAGGKLALWSSCWSSGERLENGCFWMSSSRGAKLTLSEHSANGYILLHIAFKQVQYTWCSSDWEQLLFSSLFSSAQQIRRMKSDNDHGGLDWIGWGEKCGVVPPSVKRHISSRVASPRLASQNCFTKFQ